MGRHLSELTFAAAGTWWAAVALNLWERRVLPDVAGEAPATDAVLPVVAVVPARNEARGIGACVRGLLDQTPPVRGVVVVDDGSTDDTASLATAAGAGDPRLRVVSAGPLPTGWVGKPWACHRGAQEAGDAEWLLFSDADMVFAPDAVARTLGLARRAGGGGATLFPLIRCETRAERWVIPAALVAIGTFVAPGPLARHPRAPVALAAGGCILIEHSMYRRVGGHEAQAGRMVDDVTLAMRVKQAGGLLTQADGHRVAGLRMYVGAADLWRGWRKNASFAHPGGPAKAVVGAGLVAVAAVLPWTALATGVRRRRGGRALAGAAGVAAQVVLQRLSARSIPTPRRDAPTLPVGLLVLSAAAVQGAIDRASGRGAVWRGRRYPSARH